MPKKSIGGLLENVCGVGYLMKSMPNIDKTDYKEIELQPTSFDIWKTKYRLTSKDGTVWWRDRPYTGKYTFTAEKGLKKEEGSFIHSTLS